MNQKILQLKQVHLNLGMNGRITLYENVNYIINISVY